MTIYYTCPKCGYTRPAINSKAACDKCDGINARRRPAAIESSSLGERRPGPGFFMRWRRREFWIGRFPGPNVQLWLETTDPHWELTRQFREPVEIARECILHDRAALLNRTKAHA